MEVMELEPVAAPLVPMEAMDVDTSVSHDEMLNTTTNSDATVVTPILVPEEAQANIDVTDNKQAPLVMSIGEEIPITKSVLNINKVSIAPEVSNTSTTTTTTANSTTKIPVTLTKAELDKLIADRISKYLTNDSQIVDLNRKVMSIQSTKDRLCQKLASVQKQVQDLTSAMVQVSESLTNADETKSPPPPLRFFRSVGLQVNSDTRTQLSVQNSNIIRTKENAMPYKNGVLRASPASIKRNSVRYPEVNNQSPVKKSITDNGVRPEPENEIVDLTDEPKEEIKAPPALVTQQQGPVQYRVVNSPAGGITPGMQLINTPAGLQLISTSAGQNQARPVILQPISSSSGVTTPGGVVYRNVNSNSLNVRKIVPSSIQRPGVRAVSPNNANLNSRFQYAAGQVPAIRNQLTALSTFILPPLPPAAANNTIPRQTRKELPPKPELSLKAQPDGIVLSWTHSLSPDLTEIITYQIYACQESLIPTAKAATPVWKRVGDVKALPLPMACTLSQFTDENRYHFIVRGVDVYNRTGQFCDPVSIIKKKT